MKNDEILNLLYDRLAEYIHYLKLDVTSNGFFTCPTGKHTDSSPSCHIVPHNTQVFHCFACLDGDEKVRTTSGIKPIKDIKTDDMVYDMYGNFRRVTETHSHLAEFSIREVKLDKMGKVNRFTGNHGMMIVRKELMHKMPFFIKADRNKFCGSYKKKKRIGKYKDTIKIEKVLLDKVNPGDFMVFPVHVPSVSDTVLKTSNYIKETQNNSYRRIENISLNEDVMYMFGVYIAEGHVYRGGIGFSLHIKEDDIAKKVTAGLKAIDPDLNVTIIKYPDHHTQHVYCSSTDLQHIFFNLFGKGAANKKFPNFFLRLPENLRRIFLKGIMDGDGTKAGNISLISENCIKSMMHLLFTLRIVFSYGERDAYIDKNGGHHSKTYHLYLHHRESKHFFYYEINRIKYAFLSIESITDTHTFPTVYDITVDKTHTFLTEFYAVGNCNSSGNIFSLAHYIEDLPVEGYEFWTKTVPHLAKIFDIPYEPGEMDPDMKEKYQRYRAYRDATNVLCTYPEDPKSLIYKYLSERHISVETAKAMGIGCVESFDAYVKGLMACGWHRDYLMQAELLNKNIFNPVNLIFTVHDDAGRVIGFVGRDMSWKKRDKSPKYVNSSTSIIYKKGNVLYNLNRSKTHTPPLWIVEGYIDCVNMIQAGMHNVVAIGSTSFTDNEETSHVELLRKNNINDVILCLDNDEGGILGLERTLEILCKYKQFNIKICLVPDGKDPDDFIKDSGIEAFKQLPLMKPFEYKLSRFPFDADKEKIALEMVHYIAAERSPILQAQLIRTLAERTEFSIDTLERQVKILTGDHDFHKHMQFKDLQEQIVRDIHKAKTLPDMSQKLVTRSTEVTNIIEADDYTSTDTEQYRIRLSNLREDCATLTEPGFNCGRFKMLANYLDGGIPKGASMMGLAAPSNVGKSSFVRSLTIEMIMNNPDMTCIVMSIDDPFQKIVPGYLSILTGLSISDVRRARKRIWHDENKKAKWINGWKMMESLSDRLIIKDINDGSTTMSLEKYIKYYKKAAEGKKLFCVVDNFHKLRDFPNLQDRQKYTAISGRIKELTTKYDIPILNVLELRKCSEYGSRPTLQDIKECVTGETEIYNCGLGQWQRIDEVKGNVGFYTLGITKKFDIVQAKVTKWIEKGKKKIYSATTESGRNIRGSAKHPILTPEGWVDMQDLREGTPVYIVKTIGKMQIIITERIKQIITSRNETVYDITVENVHNFITKTGFCAHNTIDIEYDCDLVWLMHQELHLHTNTEWVWKAETEYGLQSMPFNELIYAKNKESGFKGTQYFRFRTDKSQYFEVNPIEIQNIDPNRVYADNIDYMSKFLKEPEPKRAMIPESCTHPGVSVPVMDKIPKVFIPGAPEKKNLF